jgi:hypothetical protein
MLGIDPGPGLVIGPACGLARAHPPRARQALTRAAAVAGKLS